MNIIKVYRNGYELQYCPERPSLRFKGGGSVKPPPVPPPQAIPDTGTDVEDIARRKAPRGRQDTFLTGDLEPEIKKKKALLG